MSYPFDLGGWSRAITTTSAQAQIWFDRGLNWTYAYNHEEAVKCFRQALEHDPACAMAHWGIALASGPFYNRAWIRFSPPEIEATLPLCHAAAQAALAELGGCTEGEQALIRATAMRYAAPQASGLAELMRRHDDYTEALRAAHAAHPGDADIAALFTEAAITRTPRQLWDLATGQPKPGSDITEVLEVLDRALAACPDHPGLLHIHIHALEMAPFPERGLRSADRLRGMIRDSGHLEHMPAHIYILVGDYAQAVNQSLRAVKADDSYLAYAGARNFYTTARCHDLHLLMYSAMFLGQYGTAMMAADRIAAEATPELIEWAPPFMSSILDGYSAMRIHVMVRFGKWRDLTLMQSPPDPGLTPIRAAMYWYGKGVAHAALSEIAEAEAAQAAYLSALNNIPEDAVFLSNPVRAMLAVGEAMLEGELAYRRREYDTAFAALREAVARDDALNYTEPWAWMHPPRHALGALLAEQGRFEEAEAVYREDLGLTEGIPRCCQHPDNGWALTGLLECIDRRGGAEADLFRQRLTFARERADVPIRSSCCCRGMG